ncbi:MAG: alpha/beta hydrolase fold domain-containing protein [Isosphaeraceae bacterium]
MARLPRIGLLVGIGFFLTMSWRCSVRAGDDTAKAIYQHKALRTQEFGVGPRSFWLFEPAQPAPAVAPVVVFYHGWYATSPGVYGAWIEHLVRSGRIVVFPRYHPRVVVPPFDFLPDAVEAVRDALKILDKAPGHVKPDVNRLAVIGHSGGGSLAAQLAAAARDYGLPAPQAVVTLMPGEVTRRSYPSMGAIPATTLLVVIVSEGDFVVGDLRARQIFAEATAIPASRKKYIVYRSDLHGDPVMIAHHWIPAGYSPAIDTGEGLLPGLQRGLAEVDLFDRTGIWRVTDVTLEAAFTGQTLDEASAKGAIFRRLGRWSDGLPIIPPLVGDDLATIPRVVTSNGLLLFDWSSRIAGPPAPQVTRR